jgi:hypothetical protein
MLPKRNSIGDEKSDIERQIREAEIPYSAREAMAERERFWRGKSEWEIRHEMEAAVRRRFPNGVIWPHRLKAISGNRE